MTNLIEKWKHRYREWKERRKKAQATAIARQFDAIKVTPDGERAAREVMESVLDKVYDRSRDTQVVHVSIPKKFNKTVDTLQFIKSFMSFDHEYGLQYSSITRDPKKPEEDIVFFFVTPV